MELALIAIPFLLAGIIPLVATSSGEVDQPPHRRDTAGVVPVGNHAAAHLHDQGAIILNYPWVSTLNLSLELYLDGLSALFTLLITGIGAGVFLYAGDYMEGDDRAHRFLAQLSAFTGSMLGVVLAGNLLLLFVCWELTSFSRICSSASTAKTRKPAAPRPQALVVTAGGGLALLVGLVLLGLASGSASFTGVLQFRMQDHPWYAGVTALIMLGSFTKSAQFPFHFWLPGGMTAPTPASAFLHSATMVKAGIYLLARLYPTLGNTDLWLGGLVGVGLMTMLIGAAIALRQRDLKGLLAYATVSWLGALVLMLGLPHYEGYMAALVGIIAHALYKSPLFMVAGAIDHHSRHAHHRPTRRAGAKNARCAGDHSRQRALDGGADPPTGFAAKEALLHAVTELHEPAARCLDRHQSGGIFTVTAGAILIWDVFFEKPVKAEHPTITTDQEHGHHLSPYMLVGPGVIAAVSVVLALLIEPVLVPFLELAAPEGVHFELHLFPGFNPIFFLSLGLIALGVVVFLRAAGG